MACGAGMAALSFAICSCVVLASSALLRARVFLEFIFTHTFKVPKKVISEAFEADWPEQYRVHFGLTCLRSGMPDHSFVVTLFSKMGRDCQSHLCDLGRASHPGGCSLPLFSRFCFDPYFANGGKFEPHMSSILHQFAFAAGIVAIRLHWLKIVKRSVAVALAGITQKLRIWGYPHFRTPPWSMWVVN